MEICKFCNHIMECENVTDPRNPRHYHSFSHCTVCQADLTAEYISEKDGTRCISSRWWNPKTRKFEDN